MGDKYSIDDHKLACPRIEVAKLLCAEDDISKLIDIYPIYVEVSPAN